MFDLNFNKNKQNIKLIVLACLTFLWILIIFSFSLQNGEESSQLSGGVVAWIVELICPEDFAHTELLEFFIRKAAHFTEYFILGGLLSVTVREAKWSKPVLLPWGLGTVVACCDETIQLFSDGRAGQITDVMLDSSGVLVGCVVIYVLIRTRDKMKS